MIATRKPDHGVGLRRLLIAAALCSGVAVPLTAEAGKNCVCKANGRDYHEGDIACIRGHLARCEMYLNNTTWTQIADDCPEVRIPVRRDLATRLRKLMAGPAPRTC